MATGTLTSMILTAGASMLANGSDATLGGKPIASNSGAPLDITDSVNGETGAPTLKVMNDSTLEIQAIQSVLYTVTDKIANIANATPYINEFNSMTSGLGDSVFSAPFDLYSGNAYSVMSTSGTIDSVLTFGRTESASVLGGSATATEIEGDAKKLGTTFGSAIAFVETSNQFINAANNSSELFTGGTFPGMDSVISGSVTGVSLASQPLGADLTALGDVISWTDIANLGSPGQLLSNMLDNGTLGPMYAKLRTITVNSRIAAILGADASTITNIIAGNQSGAVYEEVQPAVKTTTSPASQQIASGSIQKGGTSFTGLSRLGTAVTNAFDGLDRPAVDVPPRSEDQIVTGLTRINPIESNIEVPLAYQYDGVASLNRLSTATRLRKATATLAPGTSLLGNLGVDLNKVARIGANLPRSVQQQIYNLFVSLSANELAQVKGILKCTQDSIATGADLFDPTKQFPTSYMTLTAPLSANGVSNRAIYTNTSGSVNDVFDSLGARLANILPNDLAIANGALARSFGQIKNIEGTNIETFSTAADATETMKDLPLIQNLTSYVPAGVVEYWTDYYGLNSNIQLATGPEGNFTLADCIGYAAGFNSALPLKQNARLLAQMNTAGELDVFYNDAGDSSSSTGVLVVLEYLIDGAYQANPGDPYIIPGGVYGAGTYATFDLAYTAVITAAKSLMQSVYSANTTAQSVQANFKRIQEQQAREKLNRAKMDLVLSDIQSQDTNATSLAGSLGSYALDVTDGGPAEFLERIANFDTLGGQAMIASMREARNISVLGAAQIQQDGILDTTPPANPGSFLTSQYTAAGAEAIIVR